MIDNLQTVFIICALNLYVNLYNCLRLVKWNFRDRLEISYRKSIKIAIISLFVSDIREKKREKPRT